jgi:hypothetical protein
MVKQLLGDEYGDYILSSAPTTLRGIQQELTDDMDCPTGDVFSTMAALEIDAGYWGESENKLTQLEENALYNLTTINCWSSYTPQSTNHSGCQLEASYAPTAQGRSSWGVKHGDLGKASVAGQLDVEGYYRHVETQVKRRATFGIDEILAQGKKLPDSRTKQGRVAKHLRAMDRKLALYEAKLKSL